MMLLYFSAAGGKLCPFPHLRSWTQERLPEYSAGHHGECLSSSTCCHVNSLIQYERCGGCQSNLQQKTLSDSPGGTNQVPSVCGVFSLYSEAAEASSHVEILDTAAEWADFQGERRCCSGPWEPLSQSHTGSRLAGDQGRDAHTA